MSEIDLLAAGILGVYGLLVGSFLNAWIWRIKTGRSVAKGRSVCPHCKTQLKWYELIPVLSFVGLRGKCRSCQKPIGLQYPLVEISTALIWLLLYCRIHPASLYGWMSLVVWLIVSSLMIAAFVYDLKWMQLPEHFTYPAIGIALVWLLLRAIGFHELDLGLWQLLGTGLFVGSFWLIWRLSDGAWLGDGDISLAVIMGLLLSPSQLIIAIFLSFNLGALIGVVLLALKIKKRTDPIPFGPFLITGLFVAFLVGDRLIDLYLRWLTV